MSTCRLEPEYIKSILTIIEDYLYFEDSIDLSNKEKISNLEESVVYEMNQQGFEDFDSFNLKDYISESKKDFKPKLEKILETYGVEIPRNLLGTPSMNHMKTNISKEFITYDINDKFHTLPMVKLGFDNYLNLKIAKAAIIGSKDSKTFVTDDKEVTNNLNDLKSELFDEIQTFLINNKLLKVSEKKSLFNPDGSVKSYTHYTSVMKKLENYFFNGKNFNIIKSYNELSKVPNIEGSDEIDTSIKEAYYNGIILNNFDTIISSTDLIDVNYNQYNNL